MGKKQFSQRSCLTYALATFGAFFLAKSFLNLCLLQVWSIEEMALHENALQFKLKSILTAPVDVFLPEAVLRPSFSLCGYSSSSSSSHEKGLPFHFHTSTLIYPAVEQPNANDHLFNVNHRYGGRPFIWMSLYPVNLSIAGNSAHHR